MTHTHISHLGLEVVGKTSDNIVFSGTLANCRRMAFAHGMEVEKYEGYLVSCDSGHAVYAPADSESFAICWMKPRGLISRGRDDYTLVMPLDLWEGQK